MKKLLLLLCSTVIYFISCESSSQKAVEYNNALVKIQQELFTTGVEYGQQLAKGDTAATERLSENVLKYIDDEEAKAKAIKYNGDDFGMKEALIALIKNSKKAIGGDFQKILALAKTDPVNGPKKMMQSLQALQYDEKIIGQRFVAAQKKFAAAHNFKLEPPQSAP